MKIEQRHWTQEQSWHGSHAPSLGAGADLVLAFGGRERLSIPERYEEVRRMYPRAHIVSASTGGEILGTEVWDDTISLTAVGFESSRIQASSITVSDPGQSHAVGAELARSLDPSGLRHVLVVSEGLRVNGSGLARGLRESLPPDVAVTGGLAGDGSHMIRTVVGLDAVPGGDVVVALGFYGSRLEVGYGSLGGWDPFGPERRVTRSHGNTLYELDNRSALELYKTYLGGHAAGLPMTGLMFPLAIRDPENQASLVRTMMAVDESTQSVTFGGDIPEGSFARLMKANFDRLVDGAAGAAQGCRAGQADGSPELALLISSVGRKLILKQRIEEEVEAVRDVLGPSTVLTGFYSYGEICPQLSSAKCELHNQTMTITTLSEVG